MFFAVGVMVVTFGDVAHAINTLSEGYQVLPGVATVIDTTPIGGDCKSVVTPSDGRDRFVPTKTLAEWDAFKSAAPGLGIALNPCGTPITLTYFEGKSPTYDATVDSMHFRVVNGKLQIFISALYPFYSWLPDPIVPGGGLDIDPVTLHAKWNILGIAEWDFYLRKNGMYSSHNNGPAQYFGKGWCDSSTYYPWNTPYCGCKADNTWGPSYLNCWWSYGQTSSPYSPSNPPPLDP